MDFLKRNKGKIIMLIFILFSAFIIIETNYESKEEVKEDISVKENSKEEKNQEKKQSKEEVKKILVDVKGQVNNPGVYETTVQNTVMDVINQAGGLTNKSDTSNINLSKKLEDEMVIIVYSKEEIRKMNTNQTSCPNYNNACIDNKDEKSNLENSDNTKSQLVNINTADQQTLQTLNGIGETKAQAIIEYRESNGKFEKIEDIKNVSGIGDSAFEKIKNNITV